MERATVRPTKNPERVPMALQLADPVGRIVAPGPGIVVVKQEERAAMPSIKTTGTYEDRDGNRFFYAEGHVLTDAQERELSLAEAGTPMTDEERKRADRAEARQREIEVAAGGGVRATGPAPENRMAPAPAENRGRKPGGKDGE